MKGSPLQDLAREVAEELPSSTMGHPFGPEYEVFKVRGKVRGVTPVPRRHHAWLPYEQETLDHARTRRERGQ